MMMFMAEFFPGTKIEIRIWGKSEIAARLGIHRHTLRRNISRIEPDMEERFQGYNKHAKVLYPEQLRIILEYMGFM